MAAIIGIVSENGLFFGGVGSTRAEALGAACDTLGEAFEEFFAIEYGGIQARIAELLGDAPRPVAPAATAPAPAGGEDHRAAGGPDDGDDTDNAAPAEPGDSGSVVDDAGDRPEPASDGGSDGASETPAEAAPTCSVCGAGVTADWAEVSLEDFGVINCPKCTV